MPTLLTTLLLSLLTLSQPQPLTQALVIEPVGRAARTPTVTDAIEHAIVTGSWTTPAAGDAVTPPEGGDPKVWRAITADDNGAFRDPALHGGYALITVESPADRIALLDARPHRHVIVNGVPRVGDVYNLGLVRIPIHLRAGTNELLFRAAHGTLTASLVDPPAPVFIEDRDRTLPDALADGANPPAPLHAAVVVTNATDQWQRGLTLTATAPAPPDAEDGGAATTTTTTLPPLAPLSLRKAAFTIQLAAASLAPDAAGSQVPVALELRDAEGNILHTSSVSLTVRRPSEKHVRTFVSGIDGSVQYFAVVPAHPPEGAAAPASLVLSLHGASVEATNQAGAYRHKPWATIVCPTNRRSFGFDWEDWGRWDALEVLAIAENLFRPDPRRIYLTGHSMGGHGTWQLGVHFPGRFAAIAPCAAWPEFWDYGGAADYPDPTPVEAVLARAVSASRTLLLLPNLAHAGVYIYHGGADTTVPVSLARAMRERLARFHPSFAYYERPGDNHWAGDHAVDWPPLFDFLRHHTLPEPRAQRRISFMTISPGVNARCGWVTIEAQDRSMEPSTIDAAIDPGAKSITISTTNVARLSLDLSPFTTGPGALPANAPLSITIDGVAIASTAGERLRFQHAAGDGPAWVHAPEPDPALKSPARSGPFKDAFRNNVLFLYGTAGAPEETAALLAKARYDAETFWYRGNGSIDILPDASFDPASHADRSIVLYGNADTNAAWSQLLADAPFEVRRGRLRVGDRTLEGDDLALLAIAPRPDSAVASVAVIAPTGLAGTRLTHQLPYFVSGVAYPDWTILGPDIYTASSRGVRAAGFFTQDWKYDPADSAWRDPPPPPPPPPPPSPPPPPPAPQPEQDQEQEQEPAAAPAPVEPTPEPQPESSPAEPAPPPTDPAPQSPPPVPNNPDPGEPLTLLSVTRASTPRSPSPPLLSPPGATAERFARPCSSPSPLTLRSPLPWGGERGQR